MNSQYQLCFYSGSLTGKIYPIDKNEMKIGRDPSCDIVLTENSVSRVHVFLYVQQNGAVVLVDNNSTNGTVVNNYQISAPVQLNENDVIGLGGDVMLVFQKATGFDPVNQWNGREIPAGNAPDSYNFEKKQGNPMENENTNLPNDGAADGFAKDGGQSQQPAGNYGFNQAYSGAGYPDMSGQNQFNQQSPAMAADNSANGSAANPYGNNPYGQMPQMPQGGFNPYGQPQMPYGGNPYGQMPQMPQGGFNPYGQPQMPFGYDPYGQQQPMSQQPQNPYGNDPYAQQQPMSQQPQNPYGNDPYAQHQPMDQQSQNPYGNDPYAQQQPMSQQPQNPYGNDPYSQQQPMGQQPQNPYGNDPYSQQQPMGYGNPYGQQPQNPYGNDPYSQQQPMGYGNNPYGQQPQNPYGNDPYSQQQMGFGNNPYGQQPQNPYGNPYGQQPYLGSQNQPGDEQEQPEKKKHTALFIILGIVLLLLILLGVYVWYVDSHRLWCDSIFSFLWDADTCAFYRGQ